MSYLHVLNLDTVGGVEELFIHFLSSTPVQHHLLITGKKPHPFFVEPIKKYASTVTLEKYFLGIKIPPYFRRKQREKALQKSSATRVILWNRLEKSDSFKNYKVIYYEHGASWIEKKSANATAFFSNVDLILANSHAAKRVLELKWGIKSSITVIHNPLKPHITSRGEPKILPQDGLTLGYIGRLIPLKGVSLILHALKELPVSTQLLIAGDGPIKPQLVKTAIQLGLQDRVHFLGCIQDVSSFYDAVDLLIVPSIREPLGLVAQEASLRGCPVIATCVDGLPEVVLDKKTGYTIRPTLPVEQYKEFGGTSDTLPDLVYDPDQDALTTPRIIDPHHLAKRIEELMNDPTTYSELSKNAIAFAQSRPSFENYSQNLLQCISS